MKTLSDLNNSLVEVSEQVEAVVSNNYEIHSQLEELKKMYEPVVGVYI